MKLIYIIHEDIYSTELILDKDEIRFRKFKCPVGKRGKWKKMRRIKHESVASFHGRMLREILR